jgi:hypothetical protein
MNYVKPEAAVLGTAVRVIEQIPTQKGPHTVIEVASPKYRVNPAYDLGE